MLKIAVCDDEQKYLNDIKRLLDEYSLLKGIDIDVSLFSHPFDLMRQSEKGSCFDIYLLDVIMPGTNGIELAGQLRRTSVDSSIVFLTTSKEYALEAFGVGATQYLVKPFERESFFSAVEAAEKNTYATRRKNILLKSDGMLRSINLRDIVYTEAHKNNQYIHLSDGTELTVRMTVTELFEAFHDPKGFTRCGSAFIVNFAKVKKLTFSAIILSGGKEIPVPRGSYPDIKQRYYAFYGER